MIVDVIYVSNVLSTYASTIVGSNIAISSSIDKIYFNLILYFPTILHIAALIYATRKIYGVSTIVHKILLVIVAEKQMLYHKLSRNTVVKNIVMNVCSRKITLLVKFMVELKSCFR